jgi:hypothetical protein
MHGCLRESGEVGRGGAVDTETTYLPIASLSMSASASA